MTRYMCCVCTWTYDSWWCLQLLSQKHPTAWVEFELGNITEDQLVTSFFKDGRLVDKVALVQMMTDSYEYVEGMVDLLDSLKQVGLEMHVCSNYPIWYTYIEDKLNVSQYLEWTYLSCAGAMKGLRKPSLECFQRIVTHAEKPPESFIFIDDRKQNVDAARQAGMKAIHFSDALSLQQELDTYLK